MFKSKWYYRVNFITNSLVEYATLPPQAGNCDNVASRNDTEVSDLNWAGVNEGYLTYQAAMDRGFSEEQLKNVRASQEAAALLLEAQITQLKLQLSEAADNDKVNNSWESFSESEKNEIIIYRQQISDIATSDGFIPELPVSPSVLVNL
jgi:hypothetical protein